MRQYKLSPSILAADFARLGAQIKEAEHTGVEYLHVDVMDGHFVPNISFGPQVVACVRKITDLTLDVHLMIDNPARFIPDFIKAGADIVNFHLEACEPGPVIKAVKNAGKKAGLTIKPATPAEAVFPYIDTLDLVLVMSVEPGFGGQALIPGCLQKAEKIADYMQKHGLEADLEMDGGIYLSNVRDVIRSGVNVIVAGSAIFEASDPAAAIRAFMDIFKSYGIE